MSHWIAISLGDVTGIGPEVTLKALSNECDESATKFVIIGDHGVLQKTRTDLGLSIELRRGELSDTLPDGAIVMNAARGPVVDSDALLAELTAGRLRAILDVTDPEPLPAGHPLWEAPNCTITPHVAGATYRYFDNVFPLLRTQLERLVQGVAPEHQVRPPR